MANYETLKAAIQSAIKQNGNNEITGALLQQSLISIINSLGTGYQFLGVAVPSTNPGTPDQNVLYIASMAGTYPNFGGIVVGEGEVAILKYNGSWTKEVTGVATAEQLALLDLEANGLSSQFEAGSINYLTGEDGTDARCVRTGHIPVSGTVIINMTFGKTIYGYYVVKYLNGVYAGYTFTQASVSATQAQIQVDDTFNSIRIRIQGNEAWTESQIANSNYIAYILGGTYEKVENILQEISKIDDINEVLNDYNILPINVRQGTTMNGASGSIFPNANSTVATFKVDGSKTYQPVIDGKLQEGYYRISYYSDENQTQFISGTNTQEGKFTTPDNAKSCALGFYGKTFVSLVLMAADDYALTLTDKLLKLSAALPFVDIVDKNIYELKALRAINWTDNTILLAENGQTVSFNGYATSEFITGDSCFVKLVSNEFSQTYTSLAIYDSNNNFISAYAMGAGRHFIYVRRDIKVKICVRSVNKSNCGYSLEADGMPDILTDKVREIAENSAVSPLAGKSISWYGTSIPLVYPQLVGRMTGAIVYNECYGSSGARMGAKTTSAYLENPDSDPYRIKGLEWPRPVYGLMMSVQERNDVITNWLSYVDTWIGTYEGEEGAPTNAKPQNINDGQHEALKATIRDLCYDVRIARHCGINHQYNLGIAAEDCSDGQARPAGFVETSDYYVIEHGFNDVSGPAWGDTVPEDYQTIPTEPLDRHTAIGSINAMIDYIYKHNPRAKVLLIGHYERQTTRGAWVKDVMEQVSEYWGIPLLKLYNNLGMGVREVVSNGYWDASNVWHDTGFTFTTSGESWTSNNIALAYSMVAGNYAGTIDGNIVRGNNATLLKQLLNITEGTDVATWKPTRTQVYMRDGLHPYSAATAQYIAQIIANWLSTTIKNQTNI